MANPTYTPQGITNIHPLDVTTGFTATNGSATIDHGGLALNANAVSPATAEFEFPLPGAPVNGNNVVFIIKVYNNTNQFVRNGVIRFVDSSANASVVSSLDDDGWRRGELFYRMHVPSVTEFVTDAGFDVTNLTHIEIELEITDNDETDVFVIRTFDIYDLSPMVLTGGTNEDPFTLDTILNTFNTEFWGFDHSDELTWLKTYPRQAGPLLEADAGIQIGDGIAGSTFFELGTLQGFSHLNQLQNRIPFRGSTGDSDYAELLGSLPALGRQVVFNLAAAQAFPPAVIFSTTFSDKSSATITYPSWLFLRTTAIFGEKSVLAGASFIDSEGSVRGGKSYVDCPFVNSVADAVIEWNGFATFDRCRIDSPDADYGFDIKGSVTILGTTYIVADGASLDLSTVTFISNPAVKKIRVDAADKTINLLVGTTGITLADVEVVAGSVAIVAAEITLTIAGIPAGGILTIWDDEEPDPQDLGTALQTTDPTPGGAINYIGSPGNALVIQFVPNTGESAAYKELNFEFTFPDTSQTLNLSQSLELEDSL